MFISENKVCFPNLGAKIMSLPNAGCPVKDFNSSLGATYSFPGEGNGTPLQYSCLENPMDGGGW